MRHGILCGIVLLWAAAARAQNAAVTIEVDAAQGRHAIDPRIYGLAYASGPDLTDLKCPLNRIGGNNTSRYNWQLNADNRGSDWYFESLGYESSVAGELGDTWIATAQAAGAEAMLTIPTVGWVAKLGPNRSGLASFSIAKYGNQTDSDWEWFSDAGNGISSTTGTEITGNDPADANVAAGSVFQQGWMQHLVGQWGNASQGGLRYYIMDNEPSIWQATHRDVHPVGATMDEIRGKILDYGAKVKAADPSAQVVGPEEWGWSGYFYSGYDQQWYANNGWGTFPDRSAHGDADYLPWLLDQLHAHEVSTGQRLLDVFTVHFYPQSGEYSGGYNDDLSPAMQLLRNRSTRSLWDPNYTDESWIADKVTLIPRLKGWVSAHYPGTQVGITEYNWGAEDHINGATTQADILGIFGREGLDMATFWTTPAASSPTYKAFKLYRNYDGSGGAFGEISISASAPEPDRLSAFAAERGSDGSLTVMVVSKVLSGSTPVTIQVSNATLGTSAQAWQLTSSNTVNRLGDVAITGTALSTSLPAQSITLFVMPASVHAVPSLSISDVHVTEPASGTTNATFTVTLSAAAADTVSVGYGTADDTAHAGSDYTAASGTLTFDPGVTSLTLTVPVLADDVSEPMETLSVNLTGPTGATIADGVGVASIADAPKPSRLQFHAARYIVSERMSRVRITVDRIGPTTHPVSVSFATGGGSATPGADYVPKSGVLTFAAGVSRAVVSITILNDRRREGPESVGMSLFAPAAGAVLGSRRAAVLTIADDDVRFGPTAP